MPTWPSSLVQEVAERRALFILGAGASIASVDPHGRRPPSWKDLLIALSTAINDEREQRYARSLIRQGRYLDAAQVIRDGVDHAEFSALIRRELQNVDFRPSRIHNAVFEMDPKVVVTMNYDEIYEKQFSVIGVDAGYVVCRYYEDHIINDLRSGRRCFLKMHGCVSDPSKLVLEKTSYFAACRDHPNFFRGLDALFLVSTLVLVGTSMEDPDLQLLLENSLIAAPSEHHHYAVMERVRHPSQKTILRNNYNVKVVEYPRGNHDMAAELLEELRTEVLEWRATHD